MEELKVFKVLALPAEPEANAIYYVRDLGHNGVTTFITDREGNAFPQISEAVIGNLDLGTFA